MKKELHFTKFSNYIFLADCRPTDECGLVIDGNPVAENKNPALAELLPGSG